jgi:hypothetical protein
VTLPMRIILYYLFDDGPVQQLEDIYSHVDEIVLLRWKGNQNTAFLSRPQPGWHMSSERVRASGRQEQGGTPPPTHTHNPRNGTIPLQREVINTHPHPH